MRSMARPPTRSEWRASNSGAVELASDVTRCAHPDRRRTRRSGSPANAARRVPEGIVVSGRDYVPVPGLPGLRVCVRPFSPHSTIVGLCYVGPVAELIAAGVANLDMLVTTKRGFDADGDRYTTDAHWRPHARSPQQRYRIWRWMRRVRALEMPGAREALVHAARLSAADRQDATVRDRRHGPRI